jgi:ribosome-binding factor A
MATPEYHRAQSSATFQEELNRLMLREEEWDNVLVTVTSVQTSADGHYVTVRVSVLPLVQVGTVLGRLRNHSKHLGFELGRLLGLRRVPELRFEAAEERGRELEV